MNQEDYQLLWKQIEQSRETTDIAWWEWDVRQNHVTFNDKKVTMIGYSAADFRDVGYEAFTDLLHPDDYERTMDAMRDYLYGRASLYQIDYRIRRSDGIYTWFMDRGIAVEAAEDGSPAVIRGLVFDLGARLGQEEYPERVITAVRSIMPDAESFGDAASRRIVTVCSVCRRLKLPDSSWTEITEQLPEILPGRVSHGICPECMDRIYPELTGGANP